VTAYSESEDLLKIFLAHSLAQWFLGGAGEGMPGESAISRRVGGGEAKKREVMGQVVIQLLRRLKGRSG
jgi:hypothetical protein